MPVLTFTIVQCYFYLIVRCSTNSISTKIISCIPENSRMNIFFAGRTYEHKSQVIFENLILRSCSFFLQWHQNKCPLRQTADGEQRMCNCKHMR